MAPLPTHVEYLEIDASADGHSEDWFPLDCAAWIVTDLAPLWLGADLRGGEGTLISRAAGARPNRAVETETSVVLPFEVLGFWTPEGPETGLELREQLDENLLAVQEAIEARPTSTDGTRQARLHRPSGDYYGDVIVGKVNLSSNGPGALKGSITLTIPRGRLLIPEGS